MPIRVLITAGTVADCKQADKLIEGITAEHLLADKGYDSARLRAHFTRGGAQTGIPTLSTRRVQVPFHRGWYRLRHRVENFFQRMKRFRAIATRYDKSCLHFLSAVQLVAVLDWICFRV